MYENDKISLLANILANVTEEEPKVSLSVNLKRPCLVQQIRIPRMNNIVHSSLPKIENPTAETEPRVEVFLLDRYSS